MSSYYYNYTVVLNYDMYKQKKISVVCTFKTNNEDFHLRR